MNFDYNSILNRLIAYLKTKTLHADLLENSSYIKILEALAQELEYEMLYDEVLTIENNWELAQNTSSLQTESKVHNYVPPRKRGATGLLRVSASETFDAPPLVNIDIPIYTTFSNGKDIKFVNIQPYSITTANNYVDIEVVQGIAKSQSFIATGDLNESFIIDNDSVEDITVKVYVNSVLWNKADDNTLLDYGSTDTRYTIENKPDYSGIIVRTGDDITGKKLTAGDAVKIEYLETLGESGNISSVNIITTVDSTVYDINNDNVEIFCKNEDELAGGENETDIEEIRVNSPRIFQTGDRASSIEDYEAIILDFSYVKKITAWGSYETNIDNGLDPWTFIPAGENLVHIAVVTTANGNLSEAQKLQLSTDINPIKPPTDILQYETVEFIKLIFNTSAFIKNTSYTLTESKAGIEQAYIDDYGIDNIEFNQNIYQSDYQALIDNLPYVQYHTTTVDLFKEIDFSTAYAVSVNLPIFPLIGTSLRIYSKLKTEPVTDYILIGTGDISGNITGEAGYNLFGSLIDPITGSGAIIVNSGLSDPYTDYDIRVVYTSSSVNLTLLERNHIFQYESSNITVDYYKGK